MIELMRRYPKYLGNLDLSFLDLVSKNINSERLYTRFGIRKLFKKASAPMLMNFWATIPS